MPPQYPYSDQHSPNAEPAHVAPCGLLFELHVPSVETGCVGAAVKIDEVDEVVEDEVIEDVGMEVVGVEIGGCELWWKGGEHDLGSVYRVRERCQNAGQDYSIAWRP